MLASSLAFLAGGGCDDDEPSRALPTPSTLPDLGPTAPTVPTPPANMLANMLGADAGEFESTVDPAAPPGDLKAEIDAFTTIDACVASRARLDPLLADAIDAIGYETFLSDACRVIDAAKARDERRCDAIDASALRERCQITVAQVAGLPDQCPLEIAGRPEDGRNPACLAIALRDGLLCAGAIERRERATCTAIATRDPKACSDLSNLADRARCLRAASRWGTVITLSSPPPRHSLPAGNVSYAVLSEGASPGPSTNVDLSSYLAHGVVLMQKREEMSFSMGRTASAGGDAVASSPHAGASLALECAVVPGNKEATVERAEWLLPGHPPLVSPPERSTLHVTMEKLEPTRGGAIAFLLEGDLADARSHFHFRGEVTTFVRDVVRSAERFGRRDREDRDGKE